MPIHERVYRRIGDEGRGRTPFAPVVIARYGGPYATRGWFTKLVLYGSFVPVVVWAFIVYTVDRESDIILELLAGISEGQHVYKTFEDVPDQEWAKLGKLVLMFSVFIQSMLGIAATPLVGSRSVADDLRTQAFEVYLSRPLTAWQYTLGKFLLVLRPLAMVMVLPLLLILLIANALLPETITATLPLYLRALAAGGALAAVNAAVILGISSLGKSRRYATVTWLMLTLGSWVVQGVLQATVGSPGLDLLGYQANLWMLAQSLLDFTPTAAIAENSPFLSVDREVWPSALILAGLAAFAFFLVTRRASRGSLG